MTPAVEIHNLTKTYAGGAEALKGIDLTIEPGDFFALLGPNGAGKSTTIGVLCSLVNKTSGVVKVFGHDLDQDRNWVKMQIGIVPQEFNFNQFEPVEEVVINQGGFYGLPRKKARERCEYLLKQLGLWEKRKSMSRQLSGGMKRRLMIARALVHEPRLLILDEPTAGVDIELRRGMWQFLTEINEQGTTIILTTHYLEEAEQLCRNIAIINEGRIIENTNMRTLLDSVSQETFVLYCDAPVSSLPTLPAMDARLIEADVIEVVLSNAQSLTAVFDVLRGHGIEVSRMKNKNNRLEELFLRLVQNSTEPAA
ncbi:MAG: ABC transporter [Halothiobacillus sp. 14-56-357]|jgi:ABC-2 type transport system ATP-binding protein|uniref:ABC transporter ATP-binding protein n=1 Tax=Halothiobacillus sp. 15-55-196 TaxID=1970382 RepID=UPI000BDD3061|nr:ABC transporter ATP-binding protein [Halothiobacillus sp. 15-55-196]OZB35434.1 MAG: ABC transporter [Halothiobacillus sp. 15-55-196]OZB55899.1 MAG: ABC transporter [Halothiobacillus sp. 14-56-357]OZB77693.1 MAG: ABC transporter [Halothiobacillus sp. 13-55-115]